MPRGDRTGPIGLGRMTGRGAGYCAGFPSPGYRNQTAFRGGFGRGFGHGYGYRNMYYATGIPGYGRYGYPEYWGPNETSYDEVSVLNKQAEILENHLEEIKKRLAKLNEDLE